MAAVTSPLAHDITETRRAADSLAMFWPVQQFCGIIRVFGTSTSSCLRSIGAFVRPARVLADTVDMTLVRLGFLENTDPVPEQDRPRRSTFSTNKKGLIVWMVKLYVDGEVDLDSVYVSLLTSLCVGSYRTDSL